MLRRASQGRERIMSERFVERTLARVLAWFDALMVANTPPSNSATFTGHQRL
jgi:hypothetical protein